MTQLKKLLRRGTDLSGTAGLFKLDAFVLALSRAYLIGLDAFWFAVIRISVF